jgi:branched-chain amino acid transport system permease protein
MKASNVDRQAAHVRAAVPWVLFTVAMAGAPWLFSSSLSVSMLSQMGIAMVACLSFNLLLGQGGMLSFGHAVYTGLGGFAAMHALNHLSHGAWALPVVLVPVAGGLAGLLCAALLGGISVRKAGMPFAMITLGVGELVFALALMLPDWFGGEGGITGNRVVGPGWLGVTLGPPLQMYYLIAAYTLVCALLMYAFTRTPLGRMLNAVRDNPQRAAFVGCDPQRVRYIAFVIAGFFAGVAGGLGALHFEIVNAEALGTTRSGAYLFFTVLGGTAVFYGPMVGAVLMVLATVLLSEWTRAWLLYLGLVFMAVVLWAPGGLAGVAQAQWRLWRAGLLGRLLPHYGVLALCGAPVFWGFAAAVEMLYWQQLHTTVDEPLSVLGVALEPVLASSWGICLASFAVGLWPTVWAARRLQTALSETAETPGRTATPQGTAPDKEAA